MTALGRVRLGLLLFTLLPWLPAGAASDRIRAVVEPAVIDELDTARLTIQVAGARDAEALDLQALRQDFDVLTTQTSSQYRSINNQVESSVEYQIMLRPRRAGDLPIPPIAVGDGTTPPLSLRVRRVAADLRAAIDRMVFFESELSTNPVYVRAQTILIRRLYYSSDAQIYSDLPGLPEVADAVVLPLGQATSTTEIRDGQRYGVIEQRFAIIPEQSGTLVVPPISVTSSVRLDAGGRSRRSGVRIGTEPLQVEVLPIPAEYPASEPWLPAENVFISDQWTPATATLEVGDPIERVLHARVAGNLSSIIPPLADDLPERHFRQYPEPPTLADDSGGMTVIGRRTQTYSLMATGPGSITLPAVELVWWDTVARAVRTSRVPERQLRIAGTAPPVPPEPQGEPAPEPAEPAVAEERDIRSEQVPWPGPERRRSLGLVLLAALGIAVAAWLAVRIGRAARAGRPPSLRDRWHDLRQACRRGDTADMHRALLAYLRAHFAASLPDALRQFREQGHGPLLERMYAGLYRPDGQQPVSGRELLRAVRSLRTSRQRRKDQDPLPALYD